MIKPPTFSRILILALMLGLNGCTTTAPETSLAARPVHHDYEIDEVLRYHQRIKKLNAAELNKEYEQTSHSFTLNKSDLNRVQLALLLSLPNTAFRDETAAYNLLKEWAKEPKVAPAGLRGFGVLLSTLLDDMRDKDKRNEALQKKLDAIKSMEKNLLQRDKP